MRRESHYWRLSRPAIISLGVGALGLTLIGVLVLHLWPSETTDEQEVLTNRTAPMANLFGDVGPSQVAETRAAEGDPLAAGLQTLAVQAPHLAGFGEPRYTDCLNTALESADLGLAAARTWAATGGETAAQHCQAIAHRTGQDFEAAATQFTRVAERTQAHVAAFAALAFADAAAMRSDLAAQLAAQDAQDAARQALADAVAQFERALVLAPDDATIATDFALILFDFGFSDAALDLVDKALSREANFAPALWAQAHILLSTGHTDAAVAVFETLTQLHANTPYGQAAEQTLAWL